MCAQDLLKCLHYFASTYYTAMGQLYDVGREFRKERKMRRAGKLKKTASASSSRSRSTAKSADHSEDSSGTEDIDLSEDEQEVEERPPGGIGVVAKAPALGRIYQLPDDCVFLLVSDQPGQPACVVPRVIILRVPFTSYHDHILHHLNDVRLYAMI